MPAPPARSASLYVHVPFCEALCPFCAFHRVQYREALARRYFDALRTEIRRYHDAGFVFSGVYVGGGTPTVVPDELVETLALIRRLFPVQEISVETNPKDLRQPVLDQLVASGVNRLSVGVQSFDDRLLREMERLERYGSGAEIAQRLDAAAPLFGTLNVDMIFNLPHQDEASLDHDLDVLLGLKANQVSMYPLMTSKGTTSKMVQRMGAVRRDGMQRAYGRILSRLRPEFSPQSGWCFSRTPGAIDEYIVEADDYVGVGSGAFSYVDGTLYATTFSLDDYVARIQKGQPSITGLRALSRSEQMKHAFLMRLFGLRLDKAWVVEHYGERFERELWPIITAFKIAGALREDATSYRLTDRGMYLWVTMMAAFFESVNAFREQMRAQLREELERPADLRLQPAHR